MLEFEKIKELTIKPFDDNVMCLAFWLSIQQLFPEQIQQAAQKHKKNEYSVNSQEAFLSFRLLESLHAAYFQAKPRRTRLNSFSRLMLEEVQKNLTMGIHSPSKQTAV